MDTLTLDGSNHNAGHVITKPGEPTTADPTLKNREPSNGLPRVGCFGFFHPYWNRVIHLIILEPVSLMEKDGEYYPERMEVKFLLYPHCPVYQIKTCPRSQHHRLQNAPIA